MDFASKLQREIEKHPDAQFYAIYERSLTTTLSGNNIIEAIKYFNNCYNSSLVLIYDAKEEKIYHARCNKKRDERGFLNQSYFDAKGNLIFNEDELTVPIKKIKPVKITKENAEHGYIDRQGKFFKCGFEMHRYLAKELFLSKTVPEPKDYTDWKADKHMDDFGWIKISSYRIHHFHASTVKLTQAQKKTLIDWMEIVGRESYKYQSGTTSKYDIEIKLNEQE